MSSINSVGGSTPIQKIATPTVQKPATTPAAQSTSSGDKVQLSGVSHLLATLKKNDVRADKVASVKAQIDAGTYETDDKLNIATDRLLDDLLK